MNTELDQEPVLTTATLISNVVRDLLYQNKFSYAHFPELVDLAVVGTGLGMLQSNIGFVNNKGSFWDTTKWEVVPRPFLDGQSLAYASAIAAWIRGDNEPEWANELPVEVKKPMRKSLKYLVKTNDSFFQPSPANHSMLRQSQHDWWKVAGSSSQTSQVVAVRHLDFDEQLNDQQESLLIDKLRSGNRAVLLHVVAASEGMKVVSEPIVDELRALSEHRDDEIRAKAMCTLTRLGQLDELTINVASKMLDSHVKFVAYSGLVAVSSLESVPEKVLPSANRGFKRSLQTCNYEFVGLYVAAYNRWFDDPQAHFENLLAEDSPEYLQIATESLANVREQLVSLG